MKTVYIFCNVLLLAIFASCMKDKKDEVIVPPLEVEAPMETTSTECYQAIVERDTITLTVDVNSVNEFKGELNYSYYEKDKNFGTLLGNVMGDTVFADYKFQSEGKTSIRELAFLKKDANTYVEGYGDIVETNGKVLFKDKSKIKFDGNIVYSRVDCK